MHDSNNAKTQINYSGRPQNRSSSKSKHSHSVPNNCAHPDLLQLYRPDIAQFLISKGTPAYRGRQILEHLMQRPNLSFAEATNLPKEIRPALDELGASTLVLLDDVTSADGATKLLLQTQDNLALETVIMRYRDRVTTCISSQIGCPCGCAFCATGAQGFMRNLSAAEIIDQARIASAIVKGEGRRLSNLVYMGMGEPMLNLQAVLDSICLLTDSRGLGIAHRAISVSTVGIPAGIRRLSKIEPQINLAVSLHAADDRTRALLIPSKFRHSLSEILKAAWDHFALTHRKLLVEYVLIAGVNDSLDDARRLAALLRGHVVTVNLIAWNPVAITPAVDSSEKAILPLSSDRGMQFNSPTPNAVLTFQRTLTAVGIEAIVRQSKGATIKAACGQLAARKFTP